MAAAVALLSVAATVSDHEPVPSWSVSAALILAGFGVIAVTQAPGWTRAVKGSLVAGAAWAIAVTFAGKLVLVLYGTPIAAIVVVFGQGLAAIRLKATRPGARALTRSGRSEPSP